MLIERFADDVVVWAPAKVNLHLEVLGKRPDGYHAIESLMVAVNLCDTLVFRDSPDGSIEIKSDDSALSIGSDNLVHKAATLLRSELGSTRGANIRLIKRIPLAAGLAGGSSDAAATLAGLNRLWDLGLSNTQLAELGARIGSDVGFFLHTPAAWCTGRGEIVTPAPIGNKLWFALFCPSFGLGTAEVYQRTTLSERPRPGSEIRRALAAGDIAAVGQLLHNRLQEAAVEVRPELADYLRLLAGFNPAGAGMSGSGSTLFALGRDRSDAARVARHLRDGPDKRFAQRVYLVRSW